MTGRRTAFLMLTPILCVAGYSAARAADLPAAPPSAPQPVAVSPWAGFYVGGNVRYAWGEERSVNILETLIGRPFFSGTFGKIEPAGVVGGGQVGYNFQTGNFVYGIEADLQASDLSDGAVGTLPYIGTGSTMTVVANSRVDWFGTVRARLGFSWQNVLFYGTGGFAYGRVGEDLATTDTFNFSSTRSRSSDRSGYVLGAGAEYMFAPGWSARLEYQYVDLGSFNVVAPEVFAGRLPTPLVIHTSVETRFHTIGVGVNYHF